MSAPANSKDKNYRTEAEHLFGVQSTSSAYSPIQFTSHAVPEKLSVMLVGVSGSASTYLYKQCMTRLGLVAHNPCTIGDSHDCILLREKIEDMVREGGICFGHVWPRVENLIVLEASGISKVWVNVRDPRQSVLSMLMWWRGQHAQCASNPDGRYLKLLLESFFSPGFFDLPLEAQIDELIEVHLPIAVQFIQGWLEASHSGRWGYQFLFTEFEELKRSPDRFYHSLFDFYGVSPDISLFYEHNSSQQTIGEYHYRAGAIEEFRSTYSPTQLARANELVPDSLFSRFTWVR